MSGGGKGGSQTTSREVPAWLEAAGQFAANRAMQGAEIGPVFNPGIQHAAFTPDQMAAFNNQRAVANAFGMGSGANMGMPAPTFDPRSGFYGYSSYPMTMGMIDQHAALYPAQAEAIQSTYMDPYAGEIPDPMAEYMAGPQVPMQMGQPDDSSGMAMGYRDGGMFDGPQGATQISGPEMGGRAARGAPSRGNGGGLLDGIGDAFGGVRDAVGDFVDNPFGRG